MEKKIIVVGDSTDHGGVVISGDATKTIMGKAIARLGDFVSCPLLYPNKKPHGVNKIIQGEPSYLINGVPVALEGHHTECGCALIGSVPATTEDRGASTVGAVKAAWSATGNVHDNDRFDSHVQLVNDQTGEPLANVDYTLTCNGKTMSGKTDENGLTLIVSAAEAITATLEIPDGNERTN